MFINNENGRPAKGSLVAEALAEERLLSDFTDTRRYSPLRGLTSSSCRGLWPSDEPFFALRAKKKLLMLFVLILGYFAVQ